MPIPVIAMGGLGAARAGMALGKTGAWSLLLGRTLALAKGRMATGAMLGATGTSLALSGGGTEDEVETQALAMFGGDTDRELLVNIVNSVKEFIGEGQWLWPTHRDGTALDANYLVLDLRQGRGFILEQYRSYKSVQAARQRGSRRTWRRFHRRGYH